MTVDTNERAREFQSCVAVFFSLVLHKLYGNWLDRCQPDLLTIGTAQADACPIFHILRLYKKRAEGKR